MFASLPYSTGHRRARCCASSSGRATVSPGIASGAKNLAFTCRDYAALRTPCTSRAFARLARIDDNLADAVARYGDAARAGIERTMKELQDLRRQASSGLIVPPAGAASALTGGGGLGGLGGGGKIQLP